ncbi:MAG: peptidylprolyl isomerase [candidate division Zixibacteria bacterium]|nr:peptidylprolyl isomerase [candidate division Zixibacteria bacterium]
MFEALRKMILPIIIVVLFFFVGMIVLEWGLGLSSRQATVEQDLAAIINGEKIDWRSYNAIYNNLYQAEAKDAEDELPESKVNELHQEAWRQILHETLVMQEVAKNNLVVTNEELYAYLRLSPPPELQGLPYFQTDGKFDYQKYINAMADPQATPFWAQVEVSARRDVTRVKLQELILQTAHVTEGEIKEWFLASTEKVKVGMINIGFDRFSRPPPQSTEEEKQVYFESNREDYPIKKRASLNIVILEKTPAPSDWETAFGKATAIRDSILAGEDFALMASRYSEDPSAKDNDGDLGWFPRGQMVDEFDRHVFQMNKDEVSDPIRTQFGWHIIKLHGLREEMAKPRGKSEEELQEQVHASHILITAPASQETLDDNYRRLEQFQNAATRSGFFKAAEDLKLIVRQTGLFFHGGNIQYLGKDGQAGQFAFDQEVDAISEVMENNSAYYVVQASEQRPEGLATFEEATDKIQMDLQLHKVLQFCQDTSAAIWAEIQNGTDFKKAATMFGEEYETPDAFDRDGYVKGLRRDPTAIGTAFSLTSPGQMSAPVEFDQGVVIFKLIERTSPDLSELTAKRDSVANVILQSKRQELYTRWFDHLVKTSEIENFVQEALAQRQSTL